MPEPDGCHKKFGSLMYLLHLSKVKLKSKNGRNKNSLNFGISVIKNTNIRYHSLPDLEISFISCNVFELFCKNKYGR